MGWTMDRLSDVYGQVQVETGRIPYSRTFGLPSRKQTIAKYVGKMRNGETKKQPEYIFEELTKHEKQSAVSSSGKQAKGLISDYPWRPGFLQGDHDFGHHLRPETHQFFVGSPHTDHSTVTASVEHS